MKTSMAERPICKAISMAAAALVMVSAVVQAHAAAMRSGFNTTFDGRNDDGTWTEPSGCFTNIDGGTCPGTLIPIGINGNFVGFNFGSVYLNTNGNLTLDSPLSTFTPFPLLTTNRQIIAPFFADVDTRFAGDVVAYGTSAVMDKNAVSHNAWGATWSNVDYYLSSVNHGSQHNDFQVLLIDRSDTGAGNFDIEFNYDRITWETGDASDGMNGTGGSSARVGFSNGSTFAFELAGSGVPGSFLDSNLATGLIYNSINTAPVDWNTVAGRYLFAVRNGQVITGIPEPGTLALMAVAVIGLGFASRRRQG